MWVVEGVGCPFKGTHPVFGFQGFHQKEHKSSFVFLEFPKRKANPVGCGLLAQVTIFAEYHIAWAVWPLSRSLDSCMTLYDPLMEFKPPDTIEKVLFLLG